MSFVGGEQYKYRVVDANTYEILEELVTMMMNKGWRPQGGVCSCEGRFYQAMWKQV